MNNLHLCKAKDVETKKWVEGQLIVDTKDNLYYIVIEPYHILASSIYSENLEYCIRYEKCYEVIPETICRLVKTLDNGEKLWERDVVEYIYLHTNITDTTTMFGVEPHLNRTFCEMYFDTRKGVIDFADSQWVIKDKEKILPLSIKYRIMQEINYEYFDEMLEAVSIWASENYGYNYDDTKKRFSDDEKFDEELFEEILTKIYSDIKILGNKIDNPELLEGENNV